MTTSRTLHPACCPKCQGTGVYIDRDLQTSFPCRHETRVDVTGLDDDTERILALEARNRDLERRLSELAAEAERQAGVEWSRAFEAALEHHERILCRIGSWVVKMRGDAEPDPEWAECVRDDCEWRHAIREEIRSLKRGVKPALK